MFVVILGPGLSEAKPHTAQNGKCQWVPFYLLRVITPPRYVKALQLPKAQPSCREMRSCAEPSCQDVKICTPGCPCMETRALPWL